eukprot:12687885-Ditylum_brightwellii.AAC.1
MPCSTMSQCISVFQRFAITSVSTLLLHHGERFGVDLSPSALFNGLTEIRLPDEQMYKQAYLEDKE